MRRPGQSRSCVKIFLRCRLALMVEDGAFSPKIDYVTHFWGACKSHYSFKSYGNFAEWVDFAYWLSFSGQGFAINGATLYIFLFVI